MNAKTRRRIRNIYRNVDLRAIWGSGKILCPWHDDHIPSLHVYPDHVFCFVCREWHSGIDLVMAQKGCSFFEALEFLEKYRGKPFEESAEPVDVTPIPTELVKEWHGNLMDDGEARRYLQERGIATVTMMRLLLGWKDGRVYTIPHFVNGQVENVKFRIHPDFQMDGERKYDSLPHRRFSELYPFDFFRSNFSNAKKLFLCEGEFDAMVLLQEGLPAMSLCSGVTHQLSRWRGFLNNFERIYILFDMDDAGSAAAEAIFKRRGKLNRSEADILGVPVEVVSWDPSWGKDVSEARGKLIPLLRKMG